MTEKQPSTEQGFTLTSVALTSLIPSPWNPRKHYDPAKVRELADSMLEHGVLTPLQVRPQGKKYEIAAGERRYRAAQLAKMADVPCLVRELTDEEFLELVNLDNLQREDLHPLEEAQGFATLMKECKGYDVAKIASRLKRTPGYVYDRLQLLKLIAPAKKVFLDGKITQGHAVLISRQISDVQEKIVAQYGPLWISDRAREELFDQDEDDPSAYSKACSVNELAHWIDQHVRFDAGVEPLPQLFPETEKKLKQADEMNVKVVAITRLSQIHPDAKTDVKVLSASSWKRADGADESETCPLAVMGLVVVGPGRGEAFAICTAKKTCAVHYADDIKAAKKNAKLEQRESKGDPKAKAALDKQRQKHEAEQAKRQRDERIREAAKGLLVAAAVEAIYAAPAKECGPDGKVGKLVVPGKNNSIDILLNVTEVRTIPRPTDGPVSVIRFWAHVQLLAERSEVEDIAKALGVDVKALKKQAADTLDNP